MMINEIILQKIWQFQYFDKNDLVTNCGKAIHVYFPGILNDNAGPDFLNARLRIGETEWAGNIEIHIRTTDWFRHDHQNDKLYSNVILHIVWINDIDIFSQSPVLSLANRAMHLEKSLLYSIFDSNHAIPCTPFLHSKHFTYDNKRLLLKIRLQRKSMNIIAYYNNNYYDWEEVLWIFLCRNMGHSVNENSFEKVATALPYRILKKYITDPLSIDALLFGMAGLLEGDFSDEYPGILKVHFERLKSFHSLKRSTSTLKFLRMRPMNFPTIRLAQLSKILTNNPQLFQSLIHTKNLTELKRYLRYELNPYWTTHYLFDKPSKSSSKTIGDSLLTNILINTIIPLQTAKSSLINKQKAFSDGIQKLNMIKPESNKIIQYFINQGIRPQCAADSQAMLELFSTFCIYKKCMDCLISHEINKDILL